jgi:high-affinity nickel-transport protein
LLALGVSGGIVPCPSALMVLLAAIALHRVGYGLLLIVAFSAGLAAVLTAVGLAFLYARRLLQRPLNSRLGRAVPVLSALIIVLVGTAICWQALRSAGVDPLVLATSPLAASPGLLSLLSLLGLGLVFGLTHALEADHVAAVSIIASERRSLWGASLIGALWGLGHTAALLAAGVAVILLHVPIDDRLASGLELGVALMLIGLGANALRALWRGERWHVHAHRHHDREHRHAHAAAPAGDPRSHHRIGLRPLLVGMVHGLAGSAALMLLILSTIPSPAAGFAYIAAFGVGSIGGMLAVSALVSLPLRLTARRFAGAHLAVRTAAALFSLILGTAMAYQLGGEDGLLLSRARASISVR